MTNSALDGKPYAGNPHVRIDEGDGASAKPRRSSLLYKKILVAVIASMFGQVYGVDGTWIGGNIGAWSNAANWENGNIPVQAGDTATFPNVT